MAIWSLSGNGETIIFDGSPFWLVSAIGVGMGPVRRLSERGPFQHGVTDVGFRYDPRVINLVTALTAESLGDADTARDLLAWVCTPGSAALRLTCVRDDGATRQIDAHVIGMVDTPVQKSERLGTMQRALVQLQAPDPSWYDPNGLSLVLEQISSGVVGFQIPLEVPWVQTVGGAIDSTDTVNYAGTWPEYPIIYLTGPLQNPVLTHVTLGLTLDFTGITIASGKTYIIDLRYGYKTVTDGDGNNAIDELSADSDLAEWRLAPGANDINLTAVNGNSNSSARLSYMLRYAGL